MRRVTTVLRLAENSPRASDTRFRDVVARRLRQDLVRLGFSQLAPLLASALVTLGTATLLGPNERGELAFTVAAASLLGAAGCLSLHIGAVNAHRAGDASAVARGLAVAGSGGGLALAAGCTFAFAGPRFALGLLNATSVALIVTSAAIVVVNLYATRAVQGLGDARSFRDAALIQALVYLAGALLTAGAFRSVTAVVVVWDLSMLVGTMYVLPGLLASARRPADGDRSRLSDIVRESLSVHIGVLGQQALFRSDTVLLGLFASAASVGLYSVAVPIAEITWIIPESLSLATFASATSVHDRARLRERHRRVTRINAAACTAFGIVVAVAATVAIPALLPRYARCVVLVWLLVPGMVLQGYARIGLASLMAARARRAAVTVGLLSFCAVALYIPFVIAWAAVGAAVASSLVYALQAGVVRKVVAGPGGAGPLDVPPGPRPHARPEAS